MLNYIIILASLLWGDSRYFHTTGSEPLTHIYFLNKDKGWACGGSGTILYTGDGGVTWAYGEVTSPVFFQGIHFINHDTGFAAGGISFLESQSYPSELFGDHSPHSMGAIFRSRDGGISWEEQNVPAMYPASFNKPSAWLFDIDFCDSINGWVSGSFGSIYKTDNGGETWRQQAYQGLNLNISTFAGYWYYAVDFIDAENGYIAGEDSIIKRTSDGGDSWSFQKGPTPLLKSSDEPQTYEDGKRYNFFRDICFVNSDVGWAAGDNGCIMKTNDGGNNWAAQDIPIGSSLKELVDLKSIYFVSQNKGWAVGHLGSGILKTSDGGSTWEWVKTGGLNGWYNSVFFIDELEGWAAGECGQIIHTKDGGETWEKQRGPAENNGSLAPILIIHAHGDDEVIFGGGSLSARYGMDMQLPIVTLRVTKDTRGSDRWGEVKLLGLRMAASVVGNSGHKTLDEFDSDTYSTHSQEIAHWGGSEEIMMQHIVEAIRTWKPAV
ncbi:MAG: YCF48-related protein, partial [bacterium]